LTHTVDVEPVKTCPLTGFTGGGRIVLN